MTNTSSFTLLPSVNISMEIQSMNKQGFTVDVNVAGNESMKQPKKVLHSTNTDSRPLNDQNCRHETGY